MRNFSHSLLLLSLATAFISFCHADVIELECDRLKEENFTNINRILTVCDVREFEVMDPDTNFLFKDVTEQNFTGVYIKNSNITTFPKHILDVIPQVIALSVTSCEMTTIEDFSFRNASQLLDLDLNFNEITEITEFTFAGAENVIDINLKYNAIKVVSAKAFDCVPKLEYLTLSANKLKTLDKDTFSKLVHLKELHLGQNELMSLDPQTFLHNEQLSHLNLHRNPWTETELELSTKWMKKLNLRCLFGNFSKLTLRKANSDVTVIETLDLSRCKFTKISDLTIDESIHVENLILNRNKLESLKDAPEFLRHVTHISLTGNSIEDLPEKFTKLLADVETLSLDDNPIKMSKDIFKDLKNLKKLVLGDSGSETIDAEWFTGLAKLEELSFSLINVTSFDYMALMNTLPTLKTLDVRDTSEFECSFLRKMVTDLKAIGRVDILRDSLDSYPEEDQRGNYIYGIRCDKYLKDRDGFSYSYLSNKYF